MKIIDMKDKSQADPYVIKTCGKFYMYCTGNKGVECYGSESLFEGWEYLGEVLSVAGQKDYWAPAVIEDGGKYYMYYSSMPEEADDTHTQNIKVATSDSPEGPFTFVKDLIAPFSIDAHVVKNSSGLYMFYSVNDYEAERAGTYIVCDKMNDFFTMRGKPAKMIVPTCDEEIFEKDRFRKGQHWHTIEGAFYFEKDGTHYCMYSGNCYMKPTYHIGYASCKSGEKELDRLVFEKDGNGAYKPLISADGSEASTGHNSLIEYDGKLYVVYHGRDLKENSDRTARVCELSAEGGKLKVKRI